jgi:hypothetical protein
MTFVELLSGAVAAVERDAPGCAQGMARTLGANAVGIVVDHERVTLHASSGAIRADRSDGAAAVRVATRRVAIIELIDGRRGLVDAVEAGTVLVAGSPVDLEAVDGALRWFLSGSLRSAAVRALWARYRRGAGGVASHHVYESQEP